jgi:hypothetical protein
MMVVVSMNLMPPNMIGRKACLWLRGPFGLSKNLGPKKRPNTRNKDESKEIRVSMKVEEGGVHCKK